MNNVNEDSIKIREKLFARSAAEHYLQRLSSSDFARGMYCTAQMNCHDNGSVLCVFLTKSGSYKCEVMLNRDFGRLHERIANKVRSYAEKYSSDKVFIGRRLTENDDIEYVIAGGILIGDSLEKLGIKLLDYYLTNATSYENILPERG